MELQGKVVAVLQVESGTSKSGNAWQKQLFVVETHDQYPKKCCFTLFGDKVRLCPKVGDEVLVKFDIDAREVNGRWWNSINAWSVDVKGGQQAQPAQQAPQAQPTQATQQASGSDELPF